MKPEELLKQIDFEFVEDRVMSWLSTATHYESIWLDFESIGLDFCGEKRMSLMIPDGTRPQREDFVWCLPVPTDEWEVIHALSHKFGGEAPNEVRYVNRIGARRQQIVIVLWDEQRHSEEQILEACAWLRLIKDVRRPLYVVPHARTQAGITSLIQRSMGENPMLIQSTDSLSDPPEVGS